MARLQRSLLPPSGFLSGLFSFLVSYGLLLFHSLVSLSSGIIGFILMLFLYQKGYAPDILTFGIFCQTAPKIYMGFWAGHFTDYWGKDRVLRLSTLLLILLYTGMVGITSLSLSSEAWLILIFALQVILGLLSAFYDLAFLASVSAFTLPERYRLIYGILECCTTGVVLLGPILGSFLYPLYPLSLLFGGAAFCAGLLWLFLQALSFQPSLQAQSHIHLWDGEAFRLICAHPLLRSLLIYFSGFNFLNGLASGFIVTYVLQCCGGDVTSLGLFSFWMALAALLGSILSTQCRESYLKIMIWVCGIGSALFGRVFFGGAESLLYLTIWGMVRMALTPLANTANQILWSQITPFEKRGRVFGARRFIAQGGYPLAILLGGLLFKGFRAFGYPRIGFFIQSIGMIELLFTAFFVSRALIIWRGREALDALYVKNV